MKRKEESMKKHEKGKALKKYASYILVAVIGAVCIIGLGLLVSNLSAHTVQSASEGDMGSAWVYGMALTRMFR